MAEPVRVRRLTDQEGQKLLRIVRQGSTSSVRYRRATMLLASAGGNRVPVIAQLVQADEGTVRDVIHRFSEIGLVCLDPRWAGGRPRQLSADIRRWATKHKVELCFTPTYASWANPIEAHFGPLRQFAIANSNYPNHTVQTRALHAYLRWRNTNARHPDVLAAERKERARIRSEKGIRWGGRPAATAA
ncbi:helix-turn-helix domain-containing protein [Streptomyces sp. NPDC051665]|uniref:helix-turn-helix domain-containing protein n=1 Tax=Streptomyces sp. NPDC051665 TaxID=3154647 RepID=UPI0034262B61